MSILENLSVRITGGDFRFVSQGEIGGAKYWLALDRDGNIDPKTNFGIWGDSEKRGEVLFKEALDPRKRSRMARRLDAKASSNEPIVRALIGFATTGGIKEALQAEEAKEAARLAEKNEAKRVSRIMDAGEDLLEALKLMVEKFDAVAHRSNGQLRALENARAVIARAEGK